MAEEIKNNPIIKLLLIIPLFILIKNINAFPNPATEFYGLVTINDSNAPAGTNITAYDPDNTLCGYFIVVNSGYYGLLSCNGDDTSTNRDEGAEENEQISFYVDGSRAVIFGNKTWETGSYRFVNLSVKNYAPTFDHALTTQYVNETLTLIYDVNCSDLNINDTITYYDNTTRFEINSISGVINWVTADTDVGNNNILITCSDGLLNTSGILTIVVTDVNNPPVLESIGPLIAVEGQLFIYNINATDPDANDILTYSSNATVFTINGTTGIINFTPTSAQIGNYSINISVSDSLLTDYEIISFRIVRGPYCGDGTCGSTEDCSNCPQDCGSCPTAPVSEAEAGGEAAAEAGDITRARRITACIEKWECSDWSVCSPEGFQIRRCVDINKCGTTKKKPSDTQECQYIPTCFDGMQNQGEEGVDCGGPCQPCPIHPSCTDSIKNCHDGSCEEEVDCGGPCQPCEIKKYAEIPIPKLAPLIKKFPWLLLLIVSILISSTLVGDSVYLKKITKKEFEEYRKNLRKYKKIRKKVYITTIVLSFMGLVFILYVYLTSSKPGLAEKFVWIPILLIIFALTPAFFIARRFRYYEYRRRKREELFLLEHKRRKRDLIKIEDDLLISLESKIINETTTLIKRGVFKEEEILSQINNLLLILKDLMERRKEKIKAIILENEIKTVTLTITNNHNLIDLSKDYPEFKEILIALKGLIEERKNVETIEKIERFLLSVIAIVQDKHLLSIIKSSEALIEIYNKLVDIYEYFKKQLDNKEDSEEDLIKKETIFLKKIEEITDKPKIIETIRSNAKYASLYNRLVDLYNHYKKRQEIRNELKQLERTKPNRLV